MVKMRLALLFVVVGSLVGVPAVSADPTPSTSLSCRFDPAYAWPYGPREPGVKTICIRSIVTDATTDWGCIEGVLQRHVIFELVEYAEGYVGNATYGEPVDGAGGSVYGAVKPNMKPRVSYSLHRPVLIVFRTEYGGACT
jgi:hypothetical protein